MANVLFKKWWMILIQGILMIILSIYVFNNALPVLTGLSFWFGAMVLLAGIVGVIGWLLADKLEREGMSMLWSILTAIFGLIMVLNLSVAAKVISLLFGLWVLLTGLWLFLAGWETKKTDSSGWIMVIAGAFSAITALVVMFNIELAAISISTLLGLQILIAGIGLIFLAFAKKSLMSNVKDEFERLKSNLK